LPVLELPALGAGFVLGLMPVVWLSSGQTTTPTVPGAAARMLH
jgi:hypothetical protein